MPRIQTAVRRSLGTQRELVDEILTTVGRGPQRERLLREFGDMAHAHRASMKLHVYPVLPDRISKRSHLEHEDLSVRLSQMHAFETGSAMWTQWLADVSERLDRQIDRFEDEIMPAVDAALSSTAELELGELFEVTLADRPPAP